MHLLSHQAIVFINLAAAIIAVGSVVVVARVRKARDRK